MQTLSASAQRTRQQIKLLFTTNPTPDLIMMAFIARRMRRNILNAGVYCFNLTRTTSEWT